MTLPTSGPLSISQINAQFGRGNNLNAYRGTQYFTATAGPFTFPSGTIGISNFYGTTNVAPTPTYIFLTSGSTWTVPNDWNNLYNTIFCVGAGGGGGEGINGNGAGGGGGGFGLINNIALTRGSIININIGSYGAGGGTGNNGYGGASGQQGGDTWFNGTSLSSCSVGGGGGGGGAYANRN